MNDTLKMSVIVNIQMLEKEIGHRRTSEFEYLWRMDYQDLQDIQDLNIVEYNEIIKIRRK